MPLSHLDEALNSLLDLSWIGVEATEELLHRFVHEVSVTHVFPVFHHPDDACLRRQTSSVSVLAL
jgi:hypothetical protein